jgi:hypothetical protein
MSLASARISSAEREGMVDMELALLDFWLEFEYVGLGCGWGSGDGLAWDPVTALRQTMCSTSSGLKNVGGAMASLGTGTEGGGAEGLTGRRGE